MAKTKGKKGMPKPRPKREAGPNLFERLSNKKRFDVLGRNTKGETRHVGKLRTAAAEKRKSTLLVEYKQMRKTNAFIDRRFGEDDDTLTNDERAILRFQKQRLREMSGSSKFALADEGGEEEQLTHLGRSLAELQGAAEGQQFGFEDDDGYGGLGDAFVRETHFGGGLFERKAPAAHGDAAAPEAEAGGRHRSKKEVMAEVMAKSKVYKAQKQEQRGEDAEATAALDDAFEELARDGRLAGMLRPKGVRADAGPGVGAGPAAAEDDRRFDALTRELLYEGKAQPGERTLSAAELAELERHRLQALEAERVARQRSTTGGGGSGDDLVDDFGEADPAAAAAAAGQASVGVQPAGGYAARRAKRAQREAERAARQAAAAGDDTDSAGGSGSQEEGDEDDDQDGKDSEDEEGGSGGGRRPGLEQRRQAAAAGAHPLQAAFRDAAARLMAKHGLETAADEDRRDSDGPEGCDGEQEEAAASEDDDACSSGEEGPRDAAASGSDDEGDEGDAGGPGGASEEDDGEPGIAPQGMLGGAPGGGPAPGGSPEAADPGARLTLSFTPPLPESYPQFAALAEGLSAKDLGELLRRCRAFNAAALAADGRKRLQLFYGVVAQHFSTLSAADPPSLPHLDELLPHLVELTPLVPLYAATLHRARLAKAHARLAAALRDPLLRASAWPRRATLLLLRLLATLYPASDKRHPVLTPAGLYIGAALVHCPLARPRDAAVGLFLASLALHLHSQAKRFVPEPLNFAVSLLRCVPPAGAGLGGDDEDGIRWLCVAGTAEALPRSAADISPLTPADVFGGQGSVDEERFTSAAFMTSAAAAAAGLVRRAAEVFADMDALPEIMVPAQQALRSILDLGAPGSAARGGAAGAGAAAATGRGRRSRRSLEPGSLKPGGSGAGAAPAAAAACPPAPPLVAPALQELCRGVLADVDAACAAALARRRPLCVAAMVALAEARQFNPRFEQGFVAGKDYDPDRVRAERRQLQRQLRREERGAMREVRKDSAFMAGVRDSDRAAAGGERDKSARRAMSFLQQQEADFKSGGQGGMWKKRKHK